MLSEVQQLEIPRLASSYRVEVSGWDSSEEFFVEKGMLQWDDSSGQQLSLKARLREGSVVFIRLLQVSTDDNFPIPYVVSKNIRDEAGNQTGILINRLHPKPSHKQAAGIQGSPSHTNAA